MAQKILSRQDLRIKLRKREFAPVYLLFGEETYLRNLAAKTITEMVLKDSEIREFNESEISLKSSDIQTALASANQIPMIDARRIVRVSDVIVSATKNKDTIPEEDEAAIKEYLLNPAESTVLVFIADEFDRRRKISKLLIEHSVSVEFEMLHDRDLLSWAKDRLKDFGASADEKSLMHLISLVGSDVRKLTIELQKLATAALPATVITDELVEKLAPNTRELSNFDLADHLLQKNRSGALKVMKKILDDGAEPLMLLGLLSYNFHRLFLAKEMMSEGIDRKEVSRVIRLPWNKQQEFLENARRTERGRFAWILRRLAETDLSIKTSVATPRLQIEMLICELAA